MDRLKLNVEENKILAYEFLKSMSPISIYQLDAEASFLHDDFTWVHPHESSYTFHRRIEDNEIKKIGHLILKKVNLKKVKINLKSEENWNHIDKTSFIWRWYGGESKPFFRSAVIWYLPYKKILGFGDTILSFDFKATAKIESGYNIQKLVNNQGLDNWKKKDRWLFLAGS